MSFLDDHPDYLDYTSNDDLYFRSVPKHTDARRGFESLLMEVSEFNPDSYTQVLSSISRITRYGLLDDYSPFEIKNLTSNLFEVANNGKFELFMDSLSIIHEEGGVSLELINEYLNDNKIGYFASKKWGERLKWNVLTTNSQSENNTSLNENSMIVTRGEKMSTNNNKKIFITHSSKDEKTVLLFTELLRGLKIPDSQIICTSDFRHRPDNGEDAYNWLKDQFKNFDLHMIFVLSDNYFDSAMCLNEMGAAWLVESRTDILLLPGFEFKNLNSKNSCLNTRIQSCSFEKSDSVIKDWLNKLRTDLEIEFNLSKINILDWESIRDSFISNVRML